MKDPELCEAVFNAIQEPVFIVDNNLNLLCCNNQANAVFTIPGAAHTLLEATFSAELENAARKYFEKKENNKTEINIYKDGKHFCFELVFTLKNSWLIIILNDITKLRRLEKVRKDFAANVSHELRTPIQIIKGFSETLLEKKPDNEEYNIDQINHGIEIIHKNARTMENITNDLLTLVSLEDNKNSDGESTLLPMTLTNMRSLIEEAVSSVRPQAKTKGTDIEINCTDDITAMVYGPFIIQALINLLDNAIKYSPASSRVKVNAEIASMPDNSEMLISVKDKGIGIPVEFQERVFERFFRVDKARSRSAGGTGLGLAIVRHIALLHKGRVELESHAGEGSRFILHIPI